MTIRSILSGVVCGGLLLAATSFASVQSESAPTAAAAEPAIVMSVSVAPAADYSLASTALPLASMQDDDLEAAIEELIEVLEELVEALEELERAMTE